MVRETFAGGTQGIQVQPHLMMQLPSDKSVTLMKASPLSAASGRMALQQERVSELLQEEALRAGLAPSQSWLSKVEQLYTMTQIKHGK